MNHRRYLVVLSDGNDLVASNLTREQADCYAKALNDIREIKNAVKGYKFYRRRYVVRRDHNPHV